MDRSYKTIHKNTETHLDIKRSKFITYTFFCETEEEVLKNLESIQKKHFDATHNCYAYIIGKNQLIQRFSDDGEPSGTAGMPILEVIKNNNLTNILIVVTRYFGGVKLGAGGLVRAYAKGAAEGIEESVICEKRPFKMLKISFDYTFFGAIQNLLMNENYKIIDKEFTDEVMISLYVDEKELDSFKETMVNFTNNKITFEECGEKFLSVKI